MSFFIFPEATTSKQSLWSSKSSLPSINEVKNADDEERERHRSGSSTSTSNSTDEAYDTVKRVIPGVTIPTKPAQQDDEAPDLTPAKVIVFERGGDGSKTKLVSKPDEKVETDKKVKTDEKVETKPPPGPSAGSTGKKFLPRTSSTPKISRGNLSPKGKTDEGAEDIEMDVRKSVSLHDNIQRQNIRTKSTEEPKK